MSLTRKTIAFLSGNLFSFYDKSMWQAVSRAAREKEINLLTFIGGEIESKIDYNRQKNVVYNLIDEEYIDGIIGISGILGNYVTTGKLSDFYKAYSPLPVVSIGVELEGIPCILTDNRSGMRELVAHFIEDHGRRKIVFIKGPDGNPEALARFESYVATLEQYGIPLDEDLIIQGNFASYSGLHEMRSFLDKNLEFDSVIGASDFMALNAMRVLKERGIRIGREIGVGGYDDNAESKIIYPSMSTVHQPIEELGILALELMNDILEGKKVRQKIVLPARKILRHSCGCFTDKKLSLNRTYPDFEHIKTEFQLPVLNKYINSGGMQSLQECLLEDIRDESREDFIIALESDIFKFSKKGVKARGWLPLVQDIFHNVSREFDENSKYGKRILFLWNKTLSIVNSIHNHLNSYSTCAFEDKIAGIQGKSGSFTTTGDFEGFKDILVKRMQAVEINTFFLALFKDSIGKVDKEFSRLLMAVSPKGALTPSSEFYPSRKLLPGNIWDEVESPVSLIIIPICSETNSRGYVVYKESPLAGVLYETLTLLIHNTLKNLDMLDMIQRHADKLESQVNRRTFQLRKTRQQLIHAAHLAGMAEIASGVLHNIGNLLTSLSIASSEIRKTVEKSSFSGFIKANNLLEEHEDDLQDFLFRSQKGKVLLEYYKKIEGSMKKEREKIMQEVDKIGGKVDLIQKSVEMHQEYAVRKFLNEKINIVRMVDEVLESSLQDFFRNNVEVVKNYSGDIPLYISIQKAKVMHILINVFKNASEAMRHIPHGERKLVVDIEAENIYFIISVTDSGRGIEKEHMDKVFDYGFTTKKRGHGFGLHVSLIFMKEMNGSLKVESDGPGKGATFKLIFNRPPPDESD